MYIRQKYRIYPSKHQETIMTQWFGQARFVWNYMLNKTSDEYHATGKFLFCYDMHSLLPEMKQNDETKWLGEIPSQCLQQKCQDLDTALKASFKKNTNRKGFPKFKSRKTDESGIRFPITKLNGNRLILPKMKTGIKIKLHREILGTIGATTVSKDKTGAYHVSFVVKVDDVPLIQNIESSIGIDLGLKEFAVTSDAEIVANPRFMKKSTKKIVNAQRAHARKDQGSKNKEKSRIILARKYKKVTNQRKNFINQIACSTTKSNDLICVESLNVKGMMKNHKLAKSIADVSWGEFVSALEWQCKKRGKHLVKISQWYPSSKMCSGCGHHNPNLTLADRTYECSDCGLVIDRDLNAAFNILSEGINQFNTVGITEINACGVMNSDVGNSAQEAVWL